MSGVPNRNARLVTGRVPVMRETRYDRTSAVGIALLLVLLGGVILLITVWASSFLPVNYTPGVQMIIADGGFDDGEQDNSLDVESPEDLSDDPSLSNDQQDTQLEQSLEKIMAVTGEASTFNASDEAIDNNSGGRPGSAIGTGGNPLGAVRQGRKGGVPREQRWAIEFKERGGLASYAAQLDFFGIELAAAFPDKRVIYVSKLSTGFAVRESRVESGDTRLFMNWQGGGDRIKADIELLTKAGVKGAKEAVVLHFYPQETEQMLAQVELDYAGRPEEQIRRTNFRVTGDSGAWEFVVQSQKYR